LRSIDLTIRRIHEKSAALAELGTFGAEASSLLVVRSTVRTRDLARIYEATLAAAFPARIVDAVAALTTATVPSPGSAIVWIRVVGGAATLLDRPPRGVRLGT
jgi:hypothetical protein